MKEDGFSSELYLYLGGAAGALLVISIFFIYVSSSLESARKSALVQAQESLHKTYMLLTEINRRNPLPHNILIKNSDHDSYSRFSNEMSKSTPGWNMEKMLKPSMFDVAYRILRVDESAKSSELRNMLSQPQADRKALYEIEETQEILKLTAPLGEDRYIILSSYHAGLFTHLRKLDRHADMLVITTLLMAVLIVYIAYLMFNVRKKEQVLEKNYETKKKRIEKIAMVDTLTGAMSRRKFDEVYEEFIYMANNFSYRFSLILFDIDNFKSINDTYGHDVGDSVLVGISSFVKSHIRKSDLFIRWGGEEFIVLTPMLELGEAIPLAEKIREGIADISFEKVGHVTCSFGVSEYSEESDKESLFKEADHWLYQAKRDGKNRVLSKLSESTVSKGEKHEYKPATS